MSDEIAKAATDHVSPTTTVMSSTSNIPSELEPAYASLCRRITDVHGFQLPRLAALSTGTLEQHAGLCAELKSDLEAVASGLEALAELGEEQVHEHDRARARAVISDLERQLASIRTGYRKAAIASRAAVKANASHSRHQLLARAGSSSSAAPVITHDVEPQAQNASRGDAGDDALQTKTNEVTDALRRTTALMQSELERSVLSVQILDESTQTIRATQTLYSRYESLLSTSSKLVKQLERADWYDRIIIISALLFFLVVVGFIVKRRVLDKAARGVGWWVGGSYKLVGMGLGKLVPGPKTVGIAEGEEASTRLSDVLESAAPVEQVKVMPVKAPDAALSPPLLPTTRAEQVRDEL